MQIGWQDGAGNHEESEIALRNKCVNQLQRESEPFKLHILGAAWSVNVETGNVRVCDHELVNSGGEWAGRDILRAMR